MSSPPRPPSPVQTSHCEHERHELLQRLLDENQHLHRENLRLRHNNQMLKQQVVTLSKVDSVDEDEKKHAEEESSNQDDFETKVKLFVDRQMSQAEPRGACLPAEVRPLLEGIEGLVVSATCPSGAALGGFSSSMSSLESALSGPPGPSKLSLSVKNAHLLDNNRNSAITSLPPAYSLAGCNNRPVYLATNAHHLRSETTRPEPTSPSESDSSGSSPYPPGSSSSSSADLESTLRAASNLARSVLFDIDDYMRRAGRETDKAYKIEFDDDAAGGEKIERKPSNESVGCESGVDSPGETEEEDEPEDERAPWPDEPTRSMPSLDEHKWFVLPGEAACSHELFFSRLHQLSPDAQAPSPGSTYRALLGVWRSTRKRLPSLTFLYHVFDYLCDKFLTVGFCSSHCPPCAPRVDASSFRKLAIPIIKNFLQSSNFSRHIIIQVEILSAIESLAYNKPKLRPAVAEIFDTLFTSGVVEAIAFSEWSSLEDPAALFPIVPDSVASLVAYPPPSISSLEPDPKSKRPRKPKHPAPRAQPPAEAQSSAARPTNRTRLFQELHKAGFTLLKKSHSFA